MPNEVFDTGADKNAPPCENHAYCLAYIAGCERAKIKLFAETEDPARVTRESHWAQPMSTYGRSILDT